MMFVVIFYKHDALTGAHMYPDIETALKVKASFESLGAEYKANLQHAVEATADRAVLDKVNAWLNENGFNPLGPDATKPK